jgi:predicted Fe-Mo cluster-binding NifX family protein
MKIAIPVWENKVSPVLDTASRLLIVELKEGGEMSRFEIYLDERDLTRRCIRIQGLGIDTPYAVL